MPKRRRREASGGSGGAPAAAAALAVPEGGAGAAEPGGGGVPRPFQLRAAQMPLEELIYGPLPPAPANEDPYLPWHDWQIRASDLYLRFLSRGGPDAVPLSRDEVLELHRLLLRHIRLAVAWHVRRGDVGALRRFMTDRGEPLGILVGRLSIFEQDLPELAPDEPRVRDAVLEAIRRRADLLEAAGPDAAAGDLRRSAPSEAAGSGAAAGGLNPASDFARADEALGPDLGERLGRLLGRLSDDNLRRAAEDAARRAESLRVSLMPFAVGGETPPDEARDLVARYRRAGEVTRAAAEEMRRRGIFPGPAFSRAARLFGEWAPRFEAELERRLGASGPREGGEADAQAQEAER